MKRTFFTKAFVVSIFLLCWVLVAFGSGGYTPPFENAINVIVGQAPLIHGSVEGGVQVLAAEDVVLTGGSRIEGHLFVPGSPELRLWGEATFGGVVEGDGLYEPSHHTVTIHGGAALGQLRTRTDPVVLPVVAEPPVASGRKVFIRRAEIVEDVWTGASHIFVQAGAGTVTIPPGVYGSLKILCGDTGRVVLGRAGDEVPAAYVFESIDVHSGGRLDVAGPVILTLHKDFATYHDAVAGNPEHPDFLALESFGGGLHCHTNSVIHAAKVVAPAGTVAVDGCLRAAVFSRDLRIHPHGELKLGEAVPLNRPPLAANLSVAGMEDAPLIFHLPGSDPDGDALSVEIVSPPQHGTLRVSALQLTYEPEAGYHGADAFTYRLDDGIAVSEEASVEIVIAPVADRPVAIPAAYTIAEDTALGLSLEAFDEDGDAPVFQVISPPLHGLLTGSAPDLVYLPPPDFSGSDAFAFVVSDGLFTSMAAQIAITVEARNDPPTARDLAVATLPRTPVTVTLEATDVDSTNLIYEVMTAPQHGTLSGSNKNLTYTPAEEFVGTDAFTYVADDGADRSAPATVTVAVLAENSAPLVEAGADVETTITLAPSGNGLVNPGAEEPVEDGVYPGWTTVRGDWRLPSEDGPEAREGLGYFRAVGTGAAEIWQRIDFSEIDAPSPQEAPVFHFTAYARCSNASRPHAGRIVTVFRDRQGEALLERALTPQPVSDHWLLLSDVMTAPAEAVALDLRLLVDERDPDIVNEIYFDALAIHVLQGTSISLAGTVSDDGLPGEVPLQAWWTQSGGELQATLADAFDLSSEVFLPSPGHYVFTLTANDGEQAAQDSVRVTALLAADAGHASPVVDAGLDQEVVLPAFSTTLNGTVSGYESSEGEAPSVSWRGVEGNGAVIFAEPGSPLTDVYFSAPGRYTLRLSASLSGLTSHDDVVVEVGCADGGAPLDVLVLIDHSGSMGWLVPTADWPVMRARATAAFLVENLDESTDRAAVGTLDALATSLTSPSVTLSHIEDLAGSSSDPDRAIGVAIEELAAHARPEAVKLVFVLADGQATPERSQAQLARSLGYRVIVLGFGEADDTYLRTLATTPGDYHHYDYPGAAEHYADLLEEVACRHASASLEVRAGADRWARADEMLQLEGFVEYRHRAPSDLDVQWSVLAGPGTATFSDRADPRAQVSFESPGVYLLELRAASPRQAAATDTLRIVIEPEYESELIEGRVAHFPFDGSLRDTVSYQTAFAASPVDYEAGKHLLGLTVGHDLPRLFNSLRFARNHRSDLGSNDGFTISFWLKHEEGFGQQQSILQWGDDTANGLHVYYWSGFQPGLRVDVVDTAGLSHKVKQMGDLADAHTGRFAHVAFTYERGSGKARVFIDGIVNFEVYLGEIQAQTGGDLWIGGRPYGSDPWGSDLGRFGGVLDELSLFGRALSPHEVRALYVHGDEGPVPVLENAPPQVDAGPDRFLVSPDNSFSLHGSVTDFRAAGEPAPRILWTLVSGPGEALIEDAEDPTTTASVTAPGIYTFALSASDGLFKRSDEMTLYVGQSWERPVPEGLLAWWKGDGNPEDHLGRHHGFVVSAEAYAPGAVGQGFQLGVWDQVVQVTGSPSLDVGRGESFTVEFWLEPRRDDIFTRPRSILEWENGLSIALVDRNHQQIQVDLRDVDGGSHLATADNRLRRTYIFGLTHFALTYDRASGVLTFFKNGKLTESFDMGEISVETSGDLFLGGKPAFYPYASWRTYFGLLDEISLYGRALTEYEIAGIHAAGSAGKSAPWPNERPLVEAGFDIAIGSLEEGAQLAAIVLDDGHPEGVTPRITWRQLTGPGIASFSDTAIANPSVSFDVEGFYTLEITVDDGHLRAADHLEVRVNRGCALEPPSGLLSWWRGEPGGVDTMGANPLMLKGYGIVPAFVANGYELQGSVTSSYLQAKASASTDLGNGSGFTIELWAMLSNRLGSNYFFQYGTGDSRTLDAYNVISSSRRAFQVTLTDTDGQEHVITAPAIIDADNVWTHLGFTYDKVSGLARIFRNGVLSRETHLGSFTPDTPGDLYFAGAPESAHYFRGAMDEISLYDRALEPVEMAAIHAAGALGKCPPGPPNQAPQVAAGTDPLILLPETSLLLNGLAVDDGDPAALSYLWEQLEGPSGVSFADATQAATTATFPGEGVYQLQLTVSDGELSTSDRLHVYVVNQPNAVPQVDAGPDQILPLGTFVLTGTATDDGLPIDGTFTSAWSLISGPEGAVIESPESPVTSVSVRYPGTYRFELAASDGPSMSRDDVVITLVSGPFIDWVAPASPSYHTPEDTILLQANVHDVDGAVAEVSFFVDEIFVGAGITASGTITYNLSLPAHTLSPNAPHAVSVRATDLTGLTTDTGPVAQIVVIDPPRTPPLVELVSPLAGSIIQGPTEIIGTVESPLLQKYELRYRSSSGETWTTFATGQENRSEEVLGVFEPSLLPNGQYEIELRATDWLGFVYTYGPVDIVVESRAKIGHFHLAFEDLAVPLSGYPIRVQRHYDSRDTRSSDFGVGWSLGVKDIRLQTNRALGEDFRLVAHRDPDLSGSAALLSTTYTLYPRGKRIVTLAMPDDEVLQFEMVVSPAEQRFAPQTYSGVSISFEPQGDTRGSLEAIGADGSVVMSLLVSGSAGTPESPGPASLYEPLIGAGPVFDATRFRYLSPEGEEMLVDEQEGLLHLRDANGNTLTFTDSGIHHSAGESITFTRDTNGRITQIADPAGQDLRYAYDAQGRLASFTDRADAVTAYRYEDVTFPHHLTGITNALGVQAVRSEFDEDGRLVRQIDAAGNVLSLTHDLVGREEHLRDRLGNLTTRRYDLNGNVVQTTDPLGHVTTYRYDASDNEIGMTDALGQVWSKTYDDFDRLTSATDPLGNTTTFQYDDRGRLLATTDPNGHQTAFSYDAAGNLISLTDAEGARTTFAFDARGQVISMTDASGVTAHRNYDALGRKTSETVTGSDGFVLQHRSYTYDGNGNLLTGSTPRTLPDGTVELLTTVFHYDAENRPIRTTYPDGSFTETVYDALGRAVATIDELGRVFERQYDARGNVVRLLFPDGSEESSEYDEENRRIAHADPLGQTTAFTYDPAGRLIATTLPDGAVMSSAFDPLGRLVATTDPLGHTTTLDYDAAGRLVRLTDAHAESLQAFYDGKGRLHTLVDAKGNTSRYLYDKVDRRIASIFSDGSQATVTYDALGRGTATTNASGKTTFFDYDDLGRLTRVIDPLGSETAYAYDEIGNRVAQIDAEGRMTHLVYDRRGRLAGRTLPGGEMESMTYDAAGNLRGHRDFNGYTTSYSYDALDRLLTKTADASHSSLDLPHARAELAFTYNALGFRERAEAYNREGELLWEENFAYDSRRRLVAKTGLLGELVYTHDQAGNLTGLRSSGGVDVRYAYDTLHRLSEVSDLGSSEPQATHYHYDANGNRVLTAAANGVSHRYAYDPLDRLISLSVETSDGHAAQQYEYVLDASGHRSQVFENGGRSVSYAYDDAHRLIEESISGAPDGANGASAFGYDAVGNRLTQSTTIPGLENQNFSFTANDRGISDVHDANGNTLASPLSDGATDVYDFENRLIRRAKADGAVVDIVYDALGDRVQKRVEGPGETALLEHYHIDRQNPTGYSQVVEEWQTDASGDLLSTTSYVYGPELISQRIRETDPVSEGEVRYCAYDGMGSVRGLTDAAGGWTDTFDYDAWGVLIGRTGQTPNINLYRGEVYDPDLESYYLRARYLKPESGRFWTMDRFAGYADSPISQNKYLYANANPVSHTDPSGYVSLLEMQTVSLIQQLRISLVVHGGVETAYQVTGHQIFRNIHGILGIIELAHFMGGAPTLLRAFDDLARSSAGLRKVVGEMGGTPTLLATNRPNQLGRKLRTTEGLGSTSSPTFFSVSNHKGGDVWLSTTEVSQEDFRHIVESGISDGKRITILTGTHGDPAGNLGGELAERAFFVEDLEQWLSQREQVKLIDVTRLSDRQASLVLNRDGTVICAWCFSEASHIIPSNIRANK